MRVRTTASLFVMFAIAGLLGGRSVRASISGGTSVSVEFVAELRPAGAPEPYRFNIAIEPVMYRLQTLDRKYRLVRLRVSNPTAAPLALSADNDRLEALTRSGASVRAVLNPQRADPAFWDALAPETRETLAYPLSVNGTPAPGGGGRPAAPESLYIYVLLPAEVSDLPRSFRYTIASLGQTIQIATRPAMAA